MGDYTNWSNAAFDTARALSEQDGFYNGSAKRGDYTTTAASWNEQRLFIANAPRAIASEHPELAAELDAAFDELANITLPSSAHMTAVADPTGHRFACGRLELGFDSRGALTTLIDDGDAAATRTSWASAENPLGLYSYVTYSNEDYNEFLEDFTARVNGSAFRACPAHYKAGAPDDLSCRNFRKPGVTATNLTD